MAATEIAALKAVIVEKDAEITAKDVEIVSELDYDQLDIYVKLGCVKPEHESAAKRAVWVRTLGLGASQGEEDCTLLRQVLQKSNVRLMIWHAFGVRHLVEVNIPVEIASPATSVLHSGYLAEKMLAGERPWVVKAMPPHQVESVEFKVSDGSVVTGFSMASLYNRSDYHVRVEEVKVDGTLGKELCGWRQYGNASGDQPSNWTPEAVAVTTLETRFKVSVRHTTTDGNWGGVAIFRAVGLG